jgi:hypothetical protein
MGLLRDYQWSDHLDSLQYAQLSVSSDLSELTELVTERTGIQLNRIGHFDMDTECPIGPIGPTSDQQRYPSHLCRLKIFGVISSVLFTSFFGFDYVPILTRIQQAIVVPLVSVLWTQ